MKLIGRRIGRYGLCLFLILLPLIAAAISGPAARIPQLLLVGGQNWEKTATTPCIYARQAKHPCEVA